MHGLVVTVDPFVTRKDTKRNETMIFRVVKLQGSVRTQSEKVMVFWKKGEEEYMFFNFFFGEILIFYFYGVVETVFQYILGLYILLYLVSEWRHR